MPDPNNISLITITIDLSGEETSIWRGGRYTFKLTVPPEYPHKPPKAHCETPVYHPNIDTEGKVCLNILRADWKPVLDTQAIVHGLIFLFLEPNPDDPLDENIANHWKRNEKEAMQHAQKYTLEHAQGK